MDLTTKHIIESYGRELEYGAKGAYIGTKAANIYNKYIDKNASISKKITNLGTGAEYGGKAGAHLGRNAEKYAAGAGALGAYALYKLWKSLRSKKDKVNSKEDKDKIQRKMDQTKAKIDKIKKRKR